MRYALNLAEDGRVLSATLEKYAPAGSVIADTLPEGDITDYRYADGQYLHEPRKREAASVPTAPGNVTAGAYITVNGTLYKAIVNIPNGEQIVTGQNAIETTVEEQLYELAKGE